jgi:enoyl-CoA hydratase/carnithine racemase
MNFQTITYAEEGQIAVVTLNRPQRRNALSLELMLELEQCLAETGRRSAASAAA